MPACTAQVLVYMSSSQTTNLVWGQQQGRNRYFYKLGSAYLEARQVSHKAPAGREPTDWPAAASAAGHTTGAARILDMAVTTPGISESCMATSPAASNCLCWSCTVSILPPPLLLLLLLSHCHQDPSAKVHVGSGAGACSCSGGADGAGRRWLACCCCGRGWV